MNWKWQNSIQPRDLDAKSNCKSDYSISVAEENLTTSMD